MCLVATGRSLSLTTLPRLHPLRHVTIYPRRSMPSRARASANSGDCFGISRYSSSVKIRGIHARPVISLIPHAVSNVAIRWVSSSISLGHTRMMSTSLLGPSSRRATEPNINAPTTPVAWVRTVSLIRAYITSYVSSVVTAPIRTLYRTCVRLPDRHEAADGMATRPSHSAGRKVKSLRDPLRSAWSGWCRTRRSGSWASTGLWPNGPAASDVSRGSGCPMLWQQPRPWSKVSTW